MLGTIAFDVKRKRPGCVLIQAGLGASLPDFTERFGSHTWLVDMGPDMAVYPVQNEAMLEKLVAMAEEAVRGEQ